MANRQTNPKTTLISINASNGALVLVSATKDTKYSEIQECPPATFDNASNPYAPQGLVYTLPDDGYVQKYGLPPGAVLPTGDNNWRCKANVATSSKTDPANQAIPATPYAKIISATGTGTQITLKEWS